MIVTSRIQLYESAFIYRLNTKLVSFAGFSLPATSGAAGEEVGVRMMNSLESDLELNVEAKMDGARVVKFAWNIPRDKMSLLRVRFIHQLFQSFDLVFMNVHTKLVLVELQICEASASDPLIFPHVI